ncbi:MAG: hypothetical protein KBT13_02855 [Bacteroidales bacterium]|nr:hypothetical protein [Candidatus Sodaliphilus limicaballi]
MRNLFLLLVMLCGMCVQQANAQALRCDVNGDGCVDMSDVNEVINTILGKKIVDTHEFVDLGLPGGVLWATCNIGAENPEDYGKYFAWGDTIGYTRDEDHNFYWTTYKWCDGRYDNMNKYCTDSGYGTVDNKVILDPEDDAATACWGSNWRMPTLQEISYLYDDNYTSTEWATVNGVDGCMITSKSNGNSMFLPATGYRSDTDLSFTGTYGFIWTRELNVNDNSGANVLYIYAGGIINRNGDNRYYGIPVRAVRVLSE